MAFSIDVRDDEVRVWSRQSGDVAVEVDESYHPTIYASAKEEPLDWLRTRLESDPKTSHLEFVHRRTSLRDREGSTVLRIDLDRPSEINTLAREIRTVHEPDEWAPATFRLYNVDFGPKFRYCLETGTDPTPNERLRSLSLSLPEKALADNDLTALRCEGEPAGNTAAEIIQTVAGELEEQNPDVLILSTADLVPLLHQKADELEIGFGLGRLAGYRQLAEESTFQSYGRVGHSAARYNVPGRAIVDKSNSFLWSSGGLPGMIDLVERAERPLQEVAWGSIGNNFTAIQIREAHSRGVLVPWRAWRPESFSKARTLHNADRGGMTFEPDIGFHENVVEVDFASLFPNIMCIHNLSPETVRCDCHDSDDVPGLGYSVCDKQGFVPDVLQPIIDDRAELKQQIEDCDDPERVSRLEGRAESLKWILVTCFGYQGHSNSKFGRIEVHESINAWGREILLDAKVMLEDAGWKVLHGIVDSLWVTPREEEQETPIDQVCRSITDEIGIELEHEADFDWVAFVPTADGRKGALTKYFGKEAGMSDYKIRGIEARQRSTCKWIGEVQLDLIEAVDKYREPQPVGVRVARHLNELRSGSIDPESLVIKKRVSKPLEGYNQRTQTVNALERYEAHGVPRSPGQDVRYLVVDNSKKSRDRVRLHFEDLDSYDTGFYSELLLRAARSVLTPLGWDMDRLNEYLRDEEDTRLSAWT